MTRTHVIILAQGQQARLPELDIPKQWLRLPGTGRGKHSVEHVAIGAPIICRTIAQIYRLASLHSAPYVTGSADITPISMVTVCAPPLFNLLQAEGEKANQLHTLREPGNSSLKGIERYLTFRFSRPSPYAGAHERIVVLLGDVVYSWACLRALLCSPHPVSFVGTSDLSQSTGELWGVTWETEHHAIMMSLLETALAKHPPFAEYQPGQLRQWLFVGRKHADGNLQRMGMGPDEAKQFIESWLYKAVDDYTRDIDVPEHLKLLPELGRKAAADDEQNGLVW